MNGTGAGIPGRLPAASTGVEEVVVGVTAGGRTAGPGAASEQVLSRRAVVPWHRVEQYANNPIEADHSQLKRRLRPMRGLRTDLTAQVVLAGHAFLHNLRRGHYEVGVDACPALRVAAAFTELAQAIRRLSGRAQHGR